MPQPEEWPPRNRVTVNLALFEGCRNHRQFGWAFFIWRLNWCASCILKETRVPEAPAVRGREPSSSRLTNFVNLRPVFPASIPRGGWTNGTIAPAATPGTAPTAAPAACRYVGLLVALRV